MQARRRLCKLRVALMTRRSRLFAVATVIGLAVAVAALALREMVLSSTFQLFGNYVARVETAEKVVALTFDDGPSPTHTLRVLDILDQHGVKATFFMMGVNVERFPVVAREVIRRGHEIGNHSYSHPKMIWMSRTRIRDEIERTDALLRGVGVTGDIPFRPPHSAKFIALPCVLRDLRKLSVLADVDSEEWKGPSSATMTTSILHQTKPGSIIGLHDPAGAETEQTLDTILRILKGQGYRFETVAQLIRRRAA
jgi:peptidoglycan-N-acetylglucosamine deacetylase